MWFDSWNDILRILLVGAAAYVMVLLVLRAGGKRTLSQLNEFDFVVTVALGSVLATILLNSDVSWAEGLAAFLLLSGLQFVVAFTSVRFKRARRAFTSPPTLLLVDGQMQAETLRRCRLSESEVRQTIRGSGTGDLSDVKAVVLESNGTLSVITQSQYGDGSAMQDVAGAAAAQDARGA